MSGPPVRRRSGPHLDDPWAGPLGRWWGRRPGLIRGGGAALQLSPDGIFRPLVAAGARMRRGDGEVVLRFYVDGALQQADVRSWLPGASDTSIAGYVTRMNRQLDGRRFCLVLNHLQTFDASLWLRLRNFLRGLQERVGVAPGSIDVAVFVGTYRCTPFGVHRDAADSLSVVVAGRKRFLFWPGSRFEAGGWIDNSARYGRVRASATTVVASPGDLVHWPSSVWHVAESTPPYSVSLSVPVLLPHGGRADIYGAVIQQLRDALHAGARGERTFADRDAGRALRAFVTAVRQTLRRGVRAKSLAEEARGAWLRATTGHGFMAVPRLAPYRALGPGWWLRGDADYPIVWLRSGPRTLRYGANGLSFEAPLAAGLIALLRRLNRGDVVSADATRGAGRSLLEKLLQARAITRVEGRTAPRATATRRR